MAQPNLHSPLFPTWGRKHHITYAAKQHQAPSTAAAVLDQIRKKFEAQIRETADKLSLFILPEPREPERIDATNPAEVSHPPPPNIRRRHIFKPSLIDPAPAPAVELKTRSSRSRSAAARAKERRKFSLALSRQEIDEDFYSFTGRRAPGRLKRRPPAVRKHLDLLFPGLALSEITAASYDVPPARS